VVRLTKEFNWSNLILCEGTHDRGFFEELISKRKLGNFHVICPDNSNAGIDGFGRTLKGIQVNTGFDLLRNLIVVGDSDDDPEASKARLMTQLGQGGFDVADGLSLPGHPDLSVHAWMIPGEGVRGSLESLCFQAATRHNPLVAKCVDEFLVCAGTRDWPIQKLDKARLRAFVAASYKRNPDVGLGMIWANDPDLVPVTDSIFDEIANQISSIVANLH
jgi:hypothetical protein